MANPEKWSVTVVTANSSVDPYYTPAARGYLYAVGYRATATTPWPATADFRLETTDSVFIPLTSAVQLTTGGWRKYPRETIHDASGTTADYGTTGADLIRFTMVPICNQRLKYTVYNVTSTGMTGSFDFYVEGTWLSTA